MEIHGHRGARGLRPENTMPAFECAIALGVDALELDVVMTRDGVPVVHHDHALDPQRTRDASGQWLTPPGLRVDTLDLAALYEFDVGRAAPGSALARCFPEQVPCDGVRIPTLEEVLRLGKGPDVRRIRFQVEIKSSPLAPAAGAGPEALAGAVVAVLRQQSMSERASILSFDWRVLFEARKLAPDLSIVCLSAERPWFDNILRRAPGPSPWTAGLEIEAFRGSLPRMVKATGSGVWGPHYRDLTRETLAEARAHGLRSWSGPSTTSTKCADWPALASTASPPTIRIARGRRSRPGAHPGDRALPSGRASRALFARRPSVRIEGRSLPSDA